MNRREIALNVLLGGILLGIFAFLIALGIAALALTFNIVNTGLQPLVPDSARRIDIAFLALLSLWPLRAGISSLRKRFWTNAFVSFAMLPMLISMALADSSVRHDPFLAAPWWLVMFSTAEYPMIRAEFMLASSAIALTIGVDCGLLGSGLLAKIAAACVYLATVALLLIYSRRREQRNSLPASSSPAA